MDTHRPQWYSTGAQSALPQRSNKVHPSRHTAALLAILAACSTLPDTGADAGALGPVTSIEVLELPADVAGVEVEGTVLSVHACQAPLAASWCEPVQFFIDAGTLYTPAASPMVLRVVVAR